MRAAGVTDSGAVDLLDLRVDGLVIVDDQGVVRFANPAARDLLGSEPVGEPFLLPLTGQQGVLRLPDTGQGTRDVEVRAWPANWEGGPATLASIRGVTDQSLSGEGEPSGSEPASDGVPRLEESLNTPEAVRQRCILVVEDQSRIRRLVMRILRSEGFRVIEAESANAALVLLEEQGDGVDLLLTDIVMPGLSGPELAEKVHALMPGLRVVFMSGYTNGYLTDAGDDMGTAVPSERFLQKPFSVEQLLSRIGDVLDQRPPSGAADRLEK